jgi:cytochrome c oxidase subunit 2
VVIADDSYIRDSILLPLRHLVAGYHPVMPSYQGRVSEEEILMLLAYIKSLGQSPSDGG